MELAACVYYPLGGGGALHIFWIQGRAVGKGIDFPDIDTRNSINFHNFGVRIRINFQDFGMKYMVGYIFSQNRK